MKWILLIWLVFYCGPNDSTSSENNIKKSSSPKTDTRHARTLGFSSEEDDENGIHLHIWNDMGNKNNFYPNLMKHIAEESVKNDGGTASNAPNESIPNSSATHLNFNLNELLPTPQSQLSAMNLLKNALVHSLELDKFRKSDQNLYGPLYKLRTEHEANWNYHPSSVKYIPKPYMNNGAMPIISTKSPKVASEAKITTTSRPTLREQMRTTRNFVQDYYTNLPKTKPKSVIQSIGYEIGSLSKYSGRLLANEPMPQQHRTFKMFEPVPRQIMLPPPTHRIPDFKPVPPRLKIIPVIDDIISSSRNQLAVDDGSKSLPWNLVKIEQKAKSNHFLPVLPKQLQMIPFKFSEAITVAPFRHYVPKTEYSRVESSTEAYQPDIETLQRIRAVQNQITPPSKSRLSATKTTATKAPRFTGYSPNQYNSPQSNQSSSIFRRFPNNHYITDAKSQTFFNDHNKQQPSDYEYTTINKNTVGIVGLTEPVSLENARSNFTERIQTTNQQQINDIDVAQASKKSVHKKTKTMRRKPHQPSTDERSINDIIKSNITGFHEINNDDCLSKNASTENDTIKLECNTRNGNGVYALELAAYDSDRMPSDVLIDSVPSNSIQLSQTYSRQTTNVPQHKPTSSSLPLISTTTTTTTTPTTTTTENEQGEQTLQQLLASDIRKALLASLSNNTNPNDHDASTTHDPFLIAVYGENDRAMHDVSDDLQFAETAKETSDTMENGRNTKNSIQPIDRKWATDRRDTVVWPLNNNSDRSIQSKTKTKPKIKTKTELNSINNINRTDKTDPTERRFLVNNDSSGNRSSSNLIDEKYYKWFNEYAEENKKLGRTIISEHFKKVNIEPNMSWVILPRKSSINNGNEPMPLK